MFRQVYTLFLLFVFLLVFSACSNTEVETMEIVEDIQVQHEEIISLQEIIESEEIEEVEEIVPIQYEVVEYLQETEEIFIYDEQLQEMEEIEIEELEIPIPEDIINFVCVITTFSTIDSGLVYLADGVEVTIISPPRYISVGAFQEGFARASTEWSWGNNFLTDPWAWYSAQGFIDETGRDVIPLIFEDVQNFSEGLAGALYDGLWGFIDTSGEWVIPPTFHEVSPFNGGQASVTKSVYYNTWLRMGVIDKTGEVIVPFIYRSARFYSEYPNLIIVETAGGNGRLGVIDREGNEIVAPEFTHIRPISNDLFVGTRNRNNFNGLGVIDANGNEIIPFVHSFIRDVPEYERIIVRVARFGWGLFDFTGREILPPIFQEISVFSEGLSAVQKDGYWGFINPEGETVIPLKYSHVSRFIYGVAVVAKDGEVGVIDREGTVIVPFGRYRGIVHTGSEVLLVGERINPSYFGYMTDNIWGLINMAGEELIPPTFVLCRWLWWDMDFTSFSVINNAFRYSMLDVLDWNAGWGFIDTNGLIAVEPRFSHTTAFRGNYAIVGTNTKDLIWGSSGTITIGGTWHLINRQGDILASFEYAHVELISDNLLIFAENVSYSESYWGGYGRAGIIHFTVN